MDIRRTAGIVLLVGNSVALPLTGLAACESLGSIEGPNPDVRSDLGQAYTNPTGEHTKTQETEDYLNDTDEALHTGVLLVGVTAAEASLGLVGVVLARRRPRS